MEKLIALDVGDRRIGVAVSDVLGIAAHPVETIHRAKPQNDLARIVELCNQHRAAKIVVGLPRMLNGTLGVQAKKVEAFIETLQTVTDLPIVRWDERLSTVAAEKALIQSGLTRKRRKKVIDQVAAVYFLQGYLDHQSLATGGLKMPEPNR